MKAEALLQAVIAVFCYFVVVSHSKQPASTPKTPKSDSCTTEVIAFAANESTSEIIYPCENHLSVCAIAEQNITEVSALAWLSEDGQLHDCGDLGFSIEYQQGDDFFSLNVKPSGDYGDWKELEAFFTYTYSCPDGGLWQIPTCCNRQNSTVIIKVLTIALTIESVGDSGMLVNVVSDSDTDAAVLQNSTVRLTCVTNLDDSSRYWVYFRGGRTEVWCSPSTSPYRLFHLYGVTTDRNTSNFDCSLELPSVQETDASKYVCGLATSDSNEYRSYMSQAKTLTVSQPAISLDKAPGHEGNQLDIDPKEIIIGIISIIGIICVISIVVVVGNYKTSRKMRSNDISNQGYQAFGETQVPAETRKQQSRSPAVLHQPLAPSRNSTELAASTRAEGMMVEGTVHFERSSNDQSVPGDSSV